MNEKKILLNENALLSRYKSLRNKADRFFHFFFLFFFSKLFVIFVRGKLHVENERHVRLQSRMKTLDSGIKNLPSSAERTSSRLGK
ncbi:hypothetical protein PUN28_016766 [Cardiocondyla obscurior]|uniref:Uncharacterized protein n=1 Tax=Cardiocondyla obscurior TaxID=286306 RepID=A0AAW2EPV3_9HYME